MVNSPNAVHFSVQMIYYYKFVNSENYIVHGFGLSQEIDTLKFLSFECFLNGKKGGSRGTSKLERGGHEWVVQ